MSSRRRTWLKRVGFAFLFLVVIIGGLAARYATQRAEHQRLREAEVGRAPVVGPKRLQPAVQALPPALACVRGVVTHHGTPVSGMQVSLSDSPFSVSGDCPCVRPATFCGCREGLAMLPQLQRAGVVEAVKSVISDGNGAFELCGLEGDGPRLLWGEHLDGRIAISQQGPLTKPGASVELQVISPVLVRGVVMSKQVPVPNAAVVAFTMPPLIARSFTTDAQGRFEAQLLLGTSDFVVSAKGFSPQRVDQEFSSQQVLVLQLKGEGDLTVRALAEGKPVAGAEVLLASEVPVLTDQEGLARFEVTAGSHVPVRVTKGDLIGVTNVNVLEGQPRRIDVTLKKGVRVHGVVVDEQGQPRAARVRGLGKGRPAPTDERGAFDSELLPPSSSIHPVASSEGCADSQYKEVEVGESDFELTLTVTCGVSANGIVLDADGKPVQGAVVFLDGQDHNENAVTDETGTFRFHQPNAMYQLKVNHERYRKHEQPLQLPAKDVTIVLDAGGSIAGKVVDGAGKGLSGVSVMVVPAVLDALLREIEGGNTATRTDPEGNFIVTGLLAGRLVVSATADSQGTVVSEALALNPGEHREGVVLKLDERVDIQGVVIDQQRRPIPGARISWNPSDEKSALMGALMDAVSGHVDQVMRFMPSPSISDADGRYTLRGLPVSKVKLSVSANGYGSRDLQASKGDVLEIVLTKEGGRVRGRVVDESGRPLERFTVDGSTFTPDDGRFEIESYGREDTLTISAPTFTQQVVHVELTSPEKDVGDVVMKKGRQLRVEVKSEGQALVGVRVAATQKVDGNTCVTKSDGMCVIEPLLDVETKIRAVKDGFSPAQVTLPQGKFDEVLSITMKPAAGRITGVAFAAPGQPAAARNLVVAGEVHKGVLTEANGKFVAEGLPEGPYCVSLDSGSLRGLEWAINTTASPTPMELQLGPVAQGGVVKGSRTFPGRLVMVKGSSGPLPITRVLEASSQSLCESAKSSVIATLTTGGEFTVEGVPPGRWSVFHVSFSQVDEKGDMQPSSIELLANETKSLP